MTYYRGTEQKKPDKPVDIDQILRDSDPSRYTSDEDLAAAVNVALMLGKPLLLTGEPGTGKTDLASHVAMALGLEEPERFDTKSTSQAGDLFYRFDSLARFNTNEKKPALGFVTFGPLGRAILATLPPTHGLFEALKLDYPVPSTPGAVAKPRRSVILIDEIDKAPRDFPNDLLDAIDNVRFSIRELETERADALLKACKTTDITAERSLRPVVLITSNSEKNLPAPFLRRCVYYHIEFPKTERLCAIVARRASAALRNGSGAPPLTRLDPKALEAAREIAQQDLNPLLHSSVTLFQQIRSLELLKRPSTAELIDWIRYLLESGANATQHLRDFPSLVQQSLGVLVKSEEDLKAVKLWMSKVPTGGEAVR
jgi:MoxR-like ATPase